MAERQYSVNAGDAVGRRIDEAYEYGWLTAADATRATRAGAGTIRECRCPEHAKVAAIVNFFPVSGRYRSRTFADWARMSIADRRSGARPQLVLLVEDTADLREMWHVWLQHFGFDVTEARDGLEAVHKAVAHPPQIVLMDLWLPNIDGLEATRRMRRDPALTHIPIIAVSAQDAGQVAERALACGCTHFIQKPVSPDALIEHIRSVLRSIAPRTGNTC